MIVNVKQCAEYYKINHVALHVTDQERVQYCLNHLVRAFGRRDVAGITPRDCREYEARRKKKGIQQGTIRRELACLSAIFRFCERDGVIPFVPHLYLPKRPPARDIWLTEAEADKLIAAAGERAKLFIHIALQTGGRPDAIDVLTWAQVDLERGKIDFNHPGRVQTSKRRPVVPISKRLYPVLIEAKKKAATRYVLGSDCNTRKCFESARKKAGLPHVTRKTLRHTWATWAAQHGIDLWKIAGVLGDSIDTVERVYAHHHPDYLEDAVNF